MCNLIHKLVKNYATMIKKFIEFKDLDNRLVK